MEVYDEGNVGRLGCSVRIRDAVRLYVDTARSFPISTELFSNMSLTPTFLQHRYLSNLFHDILCIFESPHSIDNRTKPFNIVYEVLDGLAGLRCTGTAKD